MVVNVKLKNAPAATTTRGKYARVNTNNAKTKTLARVVALPPSDAKNENGAIHPGGRIHAQRKFAQGSNVGSPVATPVKNSKGNEAKLRKRVISPTPPFPASKRPKTEDFLTFLCFRGTPAMPPNLDFFNYNAVVEKKDSKVAVAEGKACNGTHSSQGVGSGTHSASSSKTKQKSPTPDKSKCVSSHQSTKDDIGSKAKSVHKSTSGSVSKGKPDAKVLTEKSVNKAAVAASKQSLKKMSSANNSKEKPKPLRLNEQEARFAMTALKLKYQEKRLAQTKSAISKITKKVKERSVILTRSKAKAEKSPSRSPTVLKQQKVVKKNQTKEVSKTVARNVPSPDIIYGVNHYKMRTTKSSESENSSSSSSTSSSTASSSDSSTSESEDSDPQPVVKSLRSGKEFTSIPNPVKPLVRKVALTRRMGTRAMHRTRKSPLRELPMYNANKLKKKRFAKKVDSKNNEGKSKKEVLKSKYAKTNDKDTKKSNNSKEKEMNISTEKKDFSKTNEKNRNVGKSKEKSKDAEKSIVENSKDKIKAKIVESKETEKRKIVEKSKEKETPKSITKSKEKPKIVEKSKVLEKSKEKANNQANVIEKEKSKNTEKCKEQLKSKITEKSKELQKSKIAEKLKEQQKPKISEKLKEQKSKNVEKTVMVEKSKNVEKSKIIVKSKVAEKSKTINKSKSVDKSKVIETPKIVEKSKKDVGKLKDKETPKSKEHSKENELSKSKEKPKKEKAKETDQKNESDRKSVKPSLEDKSPKKESNKIWDSFGRPMRKTKEAAGIYMGLLNKDFSSDDKDTSDEKNSGDNSDESGNTSSSETKFLEKQYNASLKRIEQQEKTSKPQTKNSKLKSSNVKAKPKPPVKKPLGRPPKAKSPDKRILRSQRTHSDDVKGPPTSMIKQQNSSSPNLVTRRRLTLPLATCDRRKEGAVRKSASIVPRRRTDFSYSSSGSDHYTSSSQDNDDDSDSDEKALAKNIEEIRRRSLEAKNKPKSPKTKGRRDDTSDSDTDSEEESSEEEESLVEKFKSVPTPSNTHINVSPCIRRTSVGEDSKNIASEMRRLVEQKRAVEEGLIIEPEKHKDNINDTEMETDTNAERSFSADDEQESTSESNVSSCSSSASASSASSSSSSCEESDEEAPPKPPVEKTSIAIQVDMDLDEEAMPLPSTSARFTEISATLTHMTHAETSTSTHTTQHDHIQLDYIPRPDINLAPPPPLPPQQYIPYSRQDFYQPLQLTPPVVSSIQLIGQGSQEFVGGHPLGIPVPVSMPLHHMTHLGPRVLPPNPLCFSSTTSITTAATLQTHIRSVAANLDIPLVRPMMGAENPLNFPLPLPRPHGHMTSHTAALTRPLNLWSNEGRNHYSAFRVPLPAGKLIHSAPQPPPSSMSNSIPMSSALPLSIVQPQHHHHHQTHPQQLPQQMTPEASSQMMQNMQQHYHQQHQQQQQQRLPLSTSGVHSLAPTRPVAGPSTSSSQSQGYSILQNLPNVSIVPRFDRNSKTVVLPPHQHSSSSMTKEHKKDKIKKEKPEGKKRKKIIIPQPPSPLTVRKDSTNPVTYVKKSHKSHPKERDSTDSTESKSDPFNKLLQMKKEYLSEGEQTVQRSAAKTSEKVEKVRLEKRSHSKDKSGEDSSGSHHKKSDKCGSSGSSSSCSTKCSSINICGSTKELQVEEVPAFYPDEEEFQDPLKYIEKIREKVEKFGMARIVLPRSFRPECNVEDDMRFTAYNHYIHKMFKRWGPNVHETAAIKEHLRKSNVDVSTPPLLGGMEVDLSTLYHTVQSFGGLKEVIEKQKWHKVSDALHIPKAANDRATKLDGIYVKYVLPYEMLSESERKKLMASVDSKWNKRMKTQLQKEEEDESDNESDEDPMQEFDECVVKGKSTPLSSYFRVARNTLSMLFQGKEPTCPDVELEYWKMVREGTRHICVYSGSIDCAGVGWGFPLPKVGAKHPWNLKVLANSQGSILRSMGPVMGATVPTLHVAMVFTTYCWYRDPHSLPWIEYLHSGANKIWYSIPGAHEEKFRKALKELMPLQCKNKKLWLASDSAMVPPELLLSRGVSVSKAVQKPGEFLVVFPKTFTSAICTGYLVSESVCFAPPTWLNSCVDIFKDIRESKEPPVFGLEKLLLSILMDNRAPSEVLQISLPLVENILEKECSMRKKLIGMGLSTGKMGANPDKVTKKKTKREEEHVYQCDTCNYLLHLSLVSNKSREFDLCLSHAIQHFSKTKSHIKGSILLFEHSEDDLNNIVQGAKNRLEKRAL